MTAPVPVAAPGANVWLDKARALAPLVVNYSDEAERERRLPLPVLQAIRDAGFLTMMLPRSLGGQELAIATCLSL
jgi:alkylation response protein AidB-like acyl-CoA dehydrogenase